MARMAPMKLLEKKSSVDWIALGAAFALCLLGLVTMNSFNGQDTFFVRQIVWIIIGVAVFFGAASVDWRFLRRDGVAASIFGILIVPLIFLLVLGRAVKGAKSWLAFGGLGIEPVDFVKLALIILLAKYFSRRHVEIRNLRHTLVSGCYAGVVFVLVALQPDFGGAIIIFLIWLGMVLFSGISRKHLLAVLALGIVCFGGLWLFGFKEYQRERILTFVNPTGDIQGAGYNAFQSMIAVGSGQLFGKGIGYGTQSKLRFLPEYQTDFIFAAFSEEWGFVGILIVFALFGIIFWRLLSAAARGNSNFETLFALGVLCYFGAHFALHVGINMGLLPVTGTTIPFMSYGGSHLLAEFLALGMVSGMARYARAGHPGLSSEFSGGYDR
jgi:rod shape determining protein RodA